MGSSGRQLSAERAHEMVEFVFIHVRALAVGPSDRWRAAEVSRAQCTKKEM